MKKVCSILMILLSIVSCVCGCSKTNKKEENITNKVVEKDHLTIYSLWNNTTLNMAIRGFTATHPKLTIDYEVGMQDLAEDNEQDVIHALNARILAGDCPDIILMDHLPVSSFIDKGVLMDMSDIFMELYRNEKLLTNIADNYMKEDKIYCMPMRFFMPVYIMSSDFSEHTKSLSDLAEFCKTSNKRFMEEHTYPQIAEMFLDTYWNEVVNDEGYVDRDKLTLFLTNILEIAKKSEAVESNGEMSDLDLANYQWARSNGEIALSEAYRTYCGGTNKLLEENIDTTVTFVEDYFYIGAYDGFAKEIHGACTPINGTYIPNGLVGISNDTDEPELAKQFVSFLFSDGIQSLDGFNGNIYDGFPINRDALNILINAEACAGYKITTVDYNGQLRNMLIKPLDTDGKRKISEVFNTLTQPAYDNKVCTKMIVEGTTEYLSGQMSLDDTVTQIMNSINLYLKE